MDLKSILNVELPNLKTSDAEGTRFATVPQIGMSCMPQFYSYILVKIWLALEWYIPMLWLAFNEVCYG